MRALITLALGLLFFPEFLSAQTIDLKPSIGLESLPADADAVCPIPTVKNTFENTGYERGKYVADFTLYTPEGTPVNLRNELTKGKPVLLVAGSYTCPVYRRQMEQLNTIFDRYKDSIGIYVVYTVEAHPKGDPSPYSGEEWVTSDNQKEGILYRQPKTYGDRKAIIADMVSRMTIKPQILIDGPCNEWWKNFGPAPNNAHLIDVNGSVAAMHGWFNRAPQDMRRPIDSLLGHTTGGGEEQFGRFDLTQTGPQRVSGEPFTTLTASLDLMNQTSLPVIVEAVRTRNSIRNGWSTAMCADICLAPEQDSFSIYLYPNTVQPFKLYFYAQSADSAKAEVTFRNANDPQNTFTLKFVGIASAPASVSDRAVSGSTIVSYHAGKLRIAQDRINAGAELWIFDVTGRVIMQDRVSQAEQDLKLVPGLYLYQLLEGGRMIEAGRLLN
jgi:hypothetical protein